MKGVVQVFFVLFEAVSGLQLYFENVCDFYHNLNENTQQFILHNTQLNNASTVSIQDRLLSDRTFDIAWNYKEGCNRITKQRAIMILRLTGRHGEGDFEERWLSADCLSDQIIAARKALGRWPPRHIPLLVSGSYNGMVSTDMANMIFQEALKQSNLWLSMDLTTRVNWREALLRMPSHSTRNDVEEYFIKSLRIIYFMGNNETAIPFWQSIANALEDFEEEICRDAWAKVLLDILLVWKSPRASFNTFMQTILDSTIFDLNFWLSAMDKTTATNNLLELFIVLLSFQYTTSDHERIRGLLRKFLLRLNVSVVRPVTMRTFVYRLVNGPYADLLKMHIDYWIGNNRLLLAVMHDLIPMGTMQLEAMRYRLRRESWSLRGVFERSGMLEYLDLGIHAKMLYDRWIRDRSNWPGLLVAHQEIKSHFARTFKKLFDFKTGDPRFDRVYPDRDWKRAFSCIEFETINGLHREFVPSACFLEALLSYRMERSFRWNMLGERFVRSCIFPTEAGEVETYWRILIIANNEWNQFLNLFPWVNTIALHALLSGDGYRTFGDNLNTSLAARQRDREREE